MKSASWAGAVVMLLAAIVPTTAADDLSLERLAMCQDSWLVWSKTDPVRMKTFTDNIQSNYSRSDAFFVPKSPKTVAGFHVTQVYPESVGMGVGFSIVVDGKFDAVRRAVEGKVGKSLKACETSDNMRSCELEIGEERTLTILAEDNAKSSTTLFGCYYYYEK